MKLSSVFAFTCLMLTAANFAHAAERQDCNVNVDITDTDPKGTNVRAAPSGAVIATLKNTAADGWIDVHITGQVGDWYEIDRAKQIDVEVDPKIIFQGKGYLHKSVLGVSGMENGAAIYTDHNIKSSPVDPHAAGDQQVDLLGCWGDFLKVHVKKGTGWTTGVCTNMLTTCS